MTQPKMINYCGEEIPDRIDISKQVYARLGPQGVGTRHYWTSFPYDKDAIEVMRMQAGCFYDGNAWNLVAHRVERAVKALTEVDRILREKGIDTDADPEKRKPAPAPKKMDRTLVLLDDNVLSGAIIDGKKGPVMVERLGAPFIGDRKYARWGKPELVGATLRYAYHRPATEAEIEAAGRISEKKDDPEENTTPEF